MKNVKIIAALLFTGTLFAQSPWTKKKNEAYLQLSFSSISNYTELFGNPDYGTDREITDNTLQLYAEYGVSDKTTLFANVPFKMVKSGNPTLNTAITPEGSESSLGNIQLGVKHNFYNKKWLVSGQVGIEANTGSYDTTTGLRTGYDAWTITPLVLVGRGFNNWYIQAFTGVDIRTNDYSSAYKLGGELGYKAVDWLWVAGFLDGVASFQNGETVIPTSNALTGLYVNNQSYAAFGLKLIGEINDKFGANVGIGGAFGGRNVAKKPAFSLGLYYKL